MNFTAADLDKMMAQQKRPANNFPPPKSGRKFLRAFYRASKKQLLANLLGLLFLGGVLFGTLLVSRCSAETLKLLQSVLGGYVETRQTQAFSGIAVSTFGSNFISLLVLFFCGFCSIAQPVILLIPLFKGLGYGFSVGMLYTEYGFSAFRYVALMLLPVMFLGALLLVAASRSSFLFSVRLFRASVSNCGINDLERAKRYCVKFVVFTLACLLIALLDATLYFKFGGLFFL